MNKIIRDIAFLLRALKPKFILRRLLITSISDNYNIRRKNIFEDG